MYNYPAALGTVVLGDFLTWDGGRHEKRGPTGGCSTMYTRQLVHEFSRNFGHIWLHKKLYRKMVAHVNYMYDLFWVTKLAVSWGMHSGTTSSPATHEFGGECGASCLLRHSLLFLQVSFHTYYSAYLTIHIWVYSLKVFSKILKQKGLAWSMSLRAVVEWSCGTTAVIHS